jgi:lipopolysaccharide export system permease LptF/LptG-like protein
MTAPGDRLRSFARRICAPATLERVIDPLIADLQFERTNALRAGRIWRARRLQFAGYLAFWRTIGMQTSRTAAGALAAWAAADRHAMSRTLGFSAAAISVTAVLLALLPFSQVERRIADAPAGLLFAYVLPQAVPLAIAFGLPLGIVIALRGRPVTRRVVWPILAMAAACAAISFIVSGWVLPAANQAFRLLVSGHPSLARGANELTLPELTARLAWLRRRAAVNDTLAFVFSYHARLAVSVAPVLMALFALSLRAATRRTAVPSAIIALALIAYVGYGAVVVIGPALSGGWPPVWAFIWFPNIVVAALSGILFISSNAYAGWRTPQSC